MLTLKIDEKWAVSYDPKRNDMPVDIFRNGEWHSKWDQNNMGTAMFYQLLNLKAVLGESRDHHEYCGWGDSWERECAEPLQKKIEEALS